MAVKTQLDPKFARIPGTGTAAKARHAIEQRELMKLAELRKPQIDAARPFVMNVRGQRSLSLANLPEDSVQRRVFESILEAFATAKKVTDAKGVTILSATAVAVEVGSAALTPLFEDEATQAAAVAGVDWAIAALRFGANKVFVKKPKAV